MVRIGAGIGSPVADRKAQYARQEDFLVAEIRRNEEFIREADAENRKLYQDIAQLDRESRRLARDYRSGKVSRDALVRQKATVEKQLATAKKSTHWLNNNWRSANQVYGETKQQRGHGSIHPTTGIQRGQTEGNPSAIQPECGQLAADVRHHVDLNPPHDPITRTAPSRYWRESGNRRSAS